MLRNSYILLVFKRVYLNIRQLFRYFFVDYFGSLGFLDQVFNFFGRKLFALIFYIDWQDTVFSIKTATWSVIGYWSFVRIMINIKRIIVPCSRTVVNQYFLSMWAYLGANTSAHIFCDFFPVFVKHLHSFKYGVHGDNFNLPLRKRWCSSLLQRPCDFPSFNAVFLLSFRSRLIFIPSEWH